MGISVDDDQQHEEKERLANANAAHAESSRSSENEEAEDVTPKSLEQMARKALECPCVADIRDGPCGKQFSEAFVCYVKSTAEEKGSDCIEPFLAMQACMEASPELFSKPELPPDEDIDPNKGDFPFPRGERRKSRSKTPPRS